MNIWWSKGPAPGNFGDILTPYILRHFGIKHTYVPREAADTLCIGSIAKYAGKGTTMIGTGAMRASDPIHPKANWLFARGPYTREVILRDGGSCPDFYGDPALLLPLICEESEKTHKIGIVPHYVDYPYVKQNYRNYKVINLINKNPLDVARQISSCEKIISSSLHGIIAAHAYNIPAAWVEFSDKVNGDGIKFYDHFASVGCQPMSSTFDKPVFQVGVVKTANIIEVFESLRHK